uniref:Uncharacterized protein n=1 Tax=Glossina morsitans morsitans TaxID=37546 RepID=A0A1B0FF01_GLOMM
MALLLKQYRGNHDEGNYNLYLYLFYALVIIIQVEGEESLVALKEQGTVKKQLKNDPASQSPFVETNPPIDNEKPVVIEKVKHEDYEDSFPSKTKEQFKEQQQPSEKMMEKFDIAKQISSHQESIMKQNEDISDSLKAGFYFFLALSSSAVIFILYKVYRLRLSRAERKYGVQGDRSTQELTPLPMAIDDGHSDDEDQTLFDVQRQQLRIL